MYVGGIAEVDSCSHAGVGQLTCGGLRLTEFGPFGVGLHWNRGLEACELHEIEGHVVVPQLTPVANHGFEERVVLLGTAYILASLIPYDTIYRHIMQGLEHGIVEYGGIFGTARVGRARSYLVEGNIGFIRPCACEREYFVSDSRLGNASGDAAVAAGIEQIGRAHV